jgi:molybdopterin converting factor small subunit
MLSIELRLYGAFRDYTADPKLNFELEHGSELESLRDLVRARLEALCPGTDPGDLLAQSVFADEHDILPRDTRFQSSQKLSLIPPVCGG